MKRRHLLHYTGGSLLLPHGLFAQPTKNSGISLCIGNSGYAGKARLKNPSADASLVNKSLADIGFQAVSAQDLTANELSSRIEVFAKQAQQQPIAWLYFAGHGVRLQGEDYICGLDNTFIDEEQIRQKSMSVSKIIALLQPKPNGTLKAAVLVIDACRNNPNSSAPIETRSISLVGSGVPKDSLGMFVGYSTAPLTLARDWPNEPNGPYATALADALGKQNRQVDDVFREVADRVYQQTKREQQPWHHSSLRGEIWLQANGLELRALGRSYAAKESAKSSGLKSVRGEWVSQTYRPELQIAQRAEYLKVDAEDWDVALYEAEQFVQRSLDIPRVQSMSARATNAASTDGEKFLAGLALISRQSPMHVRDRDKGLAFLRNAASRGHVSAQVALGEALYEDRNKSTSIAWLQAAAVSGSPRAKLDLEGVKISKTTSPQEKQQASQSAFSQVMDTIKKDVEAMNSPQKAAANMPSGCRLPHAARAPFC
jgi:hypothetical protein